MSPFDSRLTESSMPSLKDEGRRRANQHRGRVPSASWWESSIFPARPARAFARKRGRILVSLPSFQWDQTPIQPRTIPSPLVPDRSVASLDREQAAAGSLSCLLSDLQRDDPALYEHGVHVWLLTQQLAAYLLYPEQEQTTVALAALVHDVGKLTLARTLLNKPTRLSPLEYALVQQHCAAGAHLLQQMQIKDSVIELVYCHHERWDGQGYPQGLVGSAIPHGARLIAIADAFAVITTPRPYQPARSVQTALQELERNAGTQFDPLLLEQCAAYLQARR